MNIFLDCDGVLADFDQGCVIKFGLAPAEMDDADMWQRINESQTFFYDLPVMEGAAEVVKAVRKIKTPIILTGVPEVSRNIHELMKIQWANLHFPGLRIICCRPRDKIQYLENNEDILIDDMEKNVKLWERAGGRYIQHKNVTDTLERLSTMVN